MPYLFIFKDKSMLQTEEDPNEEDFESVDAGSLIVVKFENNEFLSLMSDGSWESV